MKFADIELEADYVIREGKQEIRGKIFGHKNKRTVLVQLADRGGLHFVATRNVIRRWVGWRRRA